MEPQHRWTLQWAVGTGDMPQRGLVLQGPVGTGKTWLMCAMLREAAECGVGEQGYWSLVTHPNFVKNVVARQTPVQEAPVWFERWAGLKTRLIARPDPKFPDAHKSAEEIFADLEEHCELLGLDDLDTDRYSAWKEEMILPLVERPMNDKRVIFTTNARWREWTQYFGERVADRLLDNRYYAVLEFTGTSRRRS
jgi:DNA replication protein DnaC